MTTPIQILTEVRDLFQDRSKWTQFQNARNQFGFPVEPTDPTAVCWCLNGGIAFKAGGWDTLAYYETFDLLNHVETYPITMNDFEGYDAVLQLLDKAIAHVSQ